MRRMSDDKSLGKRILGLFVETVPAGASAEAASSETPSDQTAELEAKAGARKDLSPAEEIAALAKQSAPSSSSGPPAKPPPVVAARGLSVASPAAQVPPAKVDFDAVFRGAGIDPQALDRVRKAEELLKTLPGAASDDVKRQIVEASLKAFGFEISRIIDAVETQLKALDTFVAVNQQQTTKAVADAQAQIAKLEDHVFTLKAEIDKRTTQLAALSAAAEVRKQEVAKVLQFFQVPAGPAQVAGPASTSRE
jgi:hypothetical protein